MSGYKNTAFGAATPNAERERENKMTKPIISQTEFGVNDIETWSEGLDYWCGRDEDAETEEQDSNCC